MRELPRLSFQVTNFCTGRTPPAKEKIKKGSGASPGSPSELGVGGSQDCLEGRVQAGRRWDREARGQAMRVLKVMFKLRTLFIGSGESVKVLGQERVQCELCLWRFI